MIRALFDLVHGLSWREALIAAIDILIVYYVVFRALLLIKGTRAQQMLIGLVLVGVGFFVAKLLELTTLTWLLDNLIKRAALIAHLKEREIQAPFHYVPLHSSPAGRRFGHAAGSLYVTDSIAERLVRMPMWYGLERHQDEVIEAVHAFFLRSAGEKLESDLGST